MKNASPGELVNYKESLLEFDVYLRYLVIDFSRENCHGSQMSFDQGLESSARARKPVAKDELQSLIEELSRLIYAECIQ